MSTKAWGDNIRKLRPGCALTFKTELRMETVGGKTQCLMAPELDLQGARQTRIVVGKRAPLVSGLDCRAVELEGATFTASLL